MNILSITKSFTVLVFLAIAILFQGCLDYTQITTIKKDKTGSMFIHWQYHWTGSEDSLLTQETYIFNRDSIRSQFVSKFMTIKNIEVYKDLKDSTIHGKIEFEFANFDSLKLTRAFRHTYFHIIENDNGTETFEQRAQPFILNFSSSRGSQITYIFYLPGDILKHNADKISRNKLAWQFNDKKPADDFLMTATYKPFKLKETPHIIYYLTLFVLIIVMIFLFYKRK